MLIIKEARNQLNKESITRRLGKSRVANFKISRLITRLKSPKVSQTNGEKRRLKIGFIRRFKRVKSKAKPIS